MYYMPLIDLMNIYLTLTMIIIFTIFQLNSLILRSQRKIRTDKVITTIILYSIILHTITLIFESGSAKKAALQLMRKNS